MVKIWEISIKELTTKRKTIYKVTRRIPALAIAETKITQSKEEALRQAEEWSQ